jgi:hypothetical protein
MKLKHLLWAIKETVKVAFGKTPPTVSKEQHQRKIVRTVSMMDHD